MFSTLSQLALPLLHALDPERAHEVTLRALEAGLYPRAEEPDDPKLARSVMGIAFANPLGLAAGFDKDARVPGAFIDMGCGFAEVGTLTPLAQTGNARPRVFRSLDDHAVINALGFPNDGQRAALSRLARRSRARSGVIGINIGANKDSRDRIGDYVAGVEAFAGVADYLTINISSPNTPGLRDLHAIELLDELLERVMTAREEAAQEGRKPPLVVKLSPDMAPADLPETVQCLERRGIDAIMVANTTLAREGLRDRAFGDRTGGLSGRPLFERSTAMLARVFALTEGRMQLIGVGGIDSGETAIAKIEAGASLIQLYTALVFEGPPLIQAIKTAISGHLSQNGFQSVGQMVGRRADEWAAKYEDAT
jgi:dihydroorotate dehydrogenase